jgi:hypothetical protein
MFIVGPVVALVVVCVCAAVALGVLFPFAMVAAVIYLVVRLVTPRSAAAPTAPVVSLPDDRRSDERRVAWAVGLLIAGLLWTLGRSHFAALLVAAGAGLLTRAVLTIRREAAR